ncbi:MAG: DUF1800 family protein [Candidatus Thiothrix singaporensis]|uniref:DUF1800 family protein n=1 Tax=Candidatus Thiothrix singaporensis TaxID=2799669 RepID=A0A7L6AXU4_9GAMM|nr:MAG: DUF1800 family protein [Candidatus Thiothrix singaporensis]
MNCWSCLPSASHYRESDIKAAASAFTGWTVDRNSNRFRLDAGHHAPNTNRFWAKAACRMADRCWMLCWSTPHG